MAKTDLTGLLKISLDELRMQVLGAQVLFGFQLQALFQPGFERSSGQVRIVDAVALFAISLSFAVVVAAAARHRLVERGHATVRIRRFAGRCAEISLVLLATALAGDLFAVAQAHMGYTTAAISAAAVLFTAFTLWCGLGLWTHRHRHQHEGASMQKQTVELHDRIDQMLTEARVVLPGAQAMLGFQLIVTLAPAFEQLPDTTRNVHFLALAMVTLSIAILLAPAAIHRLGYDGQDDDRFYRQGSALVTAALAPLALGIAGDIYVAMWKLSGNTELPAIAGSGMLIVLLTLWYFWPLIVRARQSAP